MQRKLNKVLRVLSILAILGYLILYEIKFWQKPFYYGLIHGFKYIVIIVLLWIVFIVLTVLYNKHERKKDGDRDVNS